VPFVVLVKARCGVASIAAGRFIRLAPESYEKSLRY
jgi:hypothetical protein